MAIANTSELPDLDSLLNGGEIQSCSYHPPSDEDGTFDPTEFAYVVKWCHEKSRTHQLHYDQYVEDQKKQLAKENEDALLEALKQSLNSFDSDHVISDFASLSTLGCDGESDKSCMLKEILLSPFSDRYSREVNSPEHVNKDIIEYGNSSPCPPGQHDSTSMKAKAPKRLGHFSELRKHMEAARVDCQRESSQTASQLGGTRLVSSRQYISKYGSASTTDFPHVTMSAEEAETTPKRVVVHPVAVAGKSGNRQRKTLTLALKSTTAAKILDGKTKAVIQNVSTSPVKAIGVTSINTSKASVEAPATVKRSHSYSDQVPSKKMCMNINSGDHDYCTEQSIATSAENPYTELTSHDDSSTTVKPNQKVVSYTEYLRQRREGVRSAPNSPASSPRVIKGSGRQSNNFMVVSFPNGHVPSNVMGVNSVAGKGKSQSTVPLPLPLKKNTVKTQFELQEFNKYITNLKDNLNCPKAPAVPDCKTQSNETTGGKPVSASQSLAAIAEQHKRKSLENGKGNNSLKIHANLSRSSSDVSNTTTTGKDKQASKSGTVPGRLGQLLMVKVPVSGSGKSTKTPSFSSGVSSAGSTVTYTTTSCKPKSDLPMINNQKTGDEHQTTRKVDENKNDCQFVSMIPGTPPKGSTTTKDSTSPTFKLMACNKDGGGGKSLILSGVSGTLKDILTKLAEQQAKSKAEGKCTGADNDEQQITILQNLISCVTSNKTETQTEATSNHDKTAPLTSTTNAPHSTITNKLTTTSSPENISPERHTQMSESTKDQTLGNCGVSSNKTTNVPVHSQANMSDVLPVQYFHTSPVSVDQSFTSNLTNEEALLDITKTSACSVTGNPACDNTTSKVDPTNDILASAMSEVRHNDASCLVEGGDRVLTLEGKNCHIASGVNESGQNIGNVATNDNDPAVITLEEALMELNNEDVINNGRSQSGDVNFSIDENLFCKLPSYYLNGRVMKEESLEDMALLGNQGMKPESCDPLIGIEAGDLEFDKLPHYFSSGKPSHGHSISTEQTASKKKDTTKGSAVKLNPVGEGQHLTPQGAPVDTSQTYYSRLPSYYSYGRPHPPVKTFNDEAADAKDDTVTPATLESESRHEKRKKNKKLKKKKKKKSKHDDNIIVDEVSKKILYSKLPSYYLSSRVVKHPGRNSRSRSPPKSYCSRSSRLRSRSYSSSPGRRRRYRSRSYSRSPYSSDSDSGSRRSWRQERPFKMSRAGRGSDRRSCKSSDDELDNFQQRRDCEVRKTRRQNQMKQENDNQQAIEERRVVYVGGIEDKITKQDLRNRFSKFGNIENVSLFFRDDKDNYGFLTFQYACDAFNAIEQGADLAPAGKRYSLCFGGRRQFCKADYEDLDSKVPKGKDDDSDDFDALLRKAQRRSLRH